MHMLAASRQLRRSLVVFCVPPLLLTFLLPQASGQVTDRGRSIERIFFAASATLIDEHAVFGGDVARAGTALAATPAHTADSGAGMHIHSVGSAAVGHGVAPSGDAAAAASYLAASVSGAGGDGAGLGHTNHGLYGTGESGRLLLSTGADFLSAIDSGVFADLPAAVVPESPPTPSARALGDVLSPQGILGAMARSGASATIAEDDANADGEVGDKRSLTAASKEKVLFFFLLGMVLMLVMYLVQARNSKTAELLSDKMNRGMTTDKYLLKILRHFSVRGVGDHVFHGIMPKSVKVSVEFQGLCTTLRGSRRIPLVRAATEDKCILTGVSGKFEGGRVTAIMGTSGAGKTTLLNVLCGKIGSLDGWKVSGMVKVNGRQTDLAPIKNVIGFVPQDDIVHERMTVRENIRFSAELRNPARTSQRRLQNIANDVLHVLQLEAQQNIIVGNRMTGGGLSGGQRKRVNVGLELAACPSLLFLDEPTSGLDSTSSLVLVRQLQKMTQLGMTVVMVIHQPRYGLFTLIDDVLLLGKGGRTIYLGPTCGAKPYFEELGFSMPSNENPADWIMDVMSGQAEIENPRIPREELPERLFKEWEQRPYPPQSQLVSVPSLDFTRGQVVTDAEEGESLKSHLKDAWKRVDQPMSTALDREQFSQVLAKCTGIEPHERVVDDLVARLEHAAANRAERCCPSETTLRHVNGHVTHPEFERYLLAIVKGGSALRSLESQSTASPGTQESGCAGEDNAVGSEASSDSDSEDLDDSEVDLGSTDDEAPQRSKVSSAFRAPMVKQTDLQRRVPGFFTQFRVMIIRRSIQWWRQQRVRFMFLVVVEFAALFLGIFDLFIFKSPPWYPTNYMNMQISLALLISVYSLRVFGAAEELPIFWRECSHSLHRPAFFLAGICVHALDMFLFSFGFGTAYYAVMLPSIGYVMYMIPIVGVSFVACGWGYLISCWLPYSLVSLGPFISALLSFVFGGILGLPTEMGVYLDGGLFETVIDVLAFTRWGVAMTFFEYIEESPPDPSLMSFKNKFLYDMSVTDYRQGWHLPGDSSYWWTGLLFLLGFGLVLRSMAFVGLCVTNRSKQA